MIIRTNKQVKVVENNGLVWISNGEVFVKNECSNGMPPLINPCLGVKLKINGKECYRLTSVTSSDKIEIIPLEEEKKLDVTTLISDDKMSANLVYTPPCRIQRKLIDANPINKLDIQVEEIILEKKEVTKNELLTELNNQGITFGILDNVVDSIVKTNMVGEYLIASGVKPILAKDQLIQYLFDESTEKKFEYNEDGFGRIDYKNIINYEAVKPGDILARVFPQKEGTNGITVTGVDIEPIPAKKLSIISNKSAQYDENTSTVIAKKNGRPEKLIKDDALIFNIIDRLTIQDVNISTGNVRFNGDIEVLKNVHESMEVLTKKNIFIKGNVCFGNIIAGNSISISSSAISSTLITGDNKIFGKDPSDEILKITNSLKKLVLNVKSIDATIADELNLETLPDKLNYLLNSKNKAITTIIYDVINTLKKDHFDIEGEQILFLLKTTRFLLGDCSQITKMKNLQEIIDTIKLMFINKEEKPRLCTTSVGYILNSEIQSKGNVIITGKGSHNSKVTTEGNVKITGSFIGGEIRAKKSVEINVLGTEIGVKTLVVVPENSQIIIRTAHNDSIIKIGRLSHRFIQKQHNVKAKIIDGKIKF